MGGGRFFGGQFGFWARKTRIREEHRTEVTEVTEGGLRRDGGRFFGGQFGFWARKTRFGEEHRTEVTEGVHPEFPREPKRQEIRRDALLTVGKPSRLALRGEPATQELKR